MIKGGKQKQVMSERAALDCAHHPCIIGLLATYYDKQHLYLLLELALGGELFALMSQARRDLKLCVPTPPPPPAFARPLLVL